MIEPCDRAQQCGFSGSRSPEQPDDLARPQRQVDFLEHDELIAVRLTEGLADLLDLQKRLDTQRSNGIHTRLLAQLIRNLRSALAYNGRQNRRFRVTTNKLRTTVPSTVRWKLPAVVAS